MEQSQIVSCLWGVADLVRDTFKRGKYQDIILPLTVRRRLDWVLADTKERVLAKQAELSGKLEKMDPRLTTKASNGQDIINYANGINGQFGFLLGQVEGNTQVTQPVKDRLLELEKVWQAIKAEVDQIEPEILQGRL